MQDIAYELKRLLKCLSFHSQHKLCHVKPHLVLSLVLITFCTLQCEAITGKHVEGWKRWQVINENSRAWNAPKWIQFLTDCLYFSTCIINHTLLLFLFKGKLYHISRNWCVWQVQSFATQWTIVLLAKCYHWHNRPWEVIASPNASYITLTPCSKMQTGHLYFDPRRWLFRLTEYSGCYCCLRKVPVMTMKCCG